MIHPEPDWRKPVGAIAIILLIIGWAVIVVTVTGLFPDLPAIIQVVAYAVAGIIWIYPARLILLWMERAL